MHRVLASSALIASALSTSVALSQETGPPSEDQPVGQEAGAHSSEDQPVGQEARAVSKDEKSADVPVDPEGVVGLAPERALIREGDIAFIAKDFKGAQAAYQSAIKRAPRKPQAHLRMAQLHLHQGDLSAAEEVLVTVKHLASGQSRAQAQTRLLLAMLRERQELYQQASQGWKDYAALAPPGEPGATAPSPSQADSSKEGSLESRAQQGDVSASSAPREGTGSQAGSLHDAASKGRGSADDPADGATSSEKAEPDSRESKEAPSGSKEAEAKSALTEDGVRIFTGTAAARQRAIDAQRKAIADAAPVKKRMDERLEEIDKKRQGDAK